MQLLERRRRPCGCPGARKAAAGPALVNTSDCSTQHVGAGVHARCRSSRRRRRCRCRRCRTPRGAMAVSVPSFFAPSGACCTALGRLPTHRCSSLRSSMSRTGAPACLRQVRGQDAVVAGAELGAEAAAHELGDRRGPWLFGSSNTVASSSRTEAVPCVEAYTVRPSGFQSATTPWVSIAECVCTCVGKWPRRHVGGGEARAPRRRAAVVAPDGPRTLPVCGTPAGGRRRRRPSRPCRPGRGRPAARPACAPPRVDDERQRLVVDLDQAGGLVGDRLRGRGHAGDALADVAHDADTCAAALRAGRAASAPCGCADDVHGLDAGQPLGGGHVDGLDARVRVAATRTRAREQHPGQPHVGRVARGAGDLEASVEARRGLADDGELVARRPGRRLVGGALALVPASSASCRTAACADHLGAGRRLSARRRPWPRRRPWGRCRSGRGCRRRRCCTSSSVGLAVALEQGRAAHDHARRAEAALHGVVGDERLLDRVQLLAVGQALDGGDLARADVEDERHARADRRAVEVHGAGAARAAVAHDLGPGQPEREAQRVGQRRRGRHLERVRLVVDVQGDRDLARTLHLAGGGVGGERLRRLEQAGGGHAEPGAGEEAATGDAARRIFFAHRATTITPIATARRASTRGRWRNIGCDRPPSAYLKAT